jgi:hypothetical protein
MCSLAAGIAFYLAGMLGWLWLAAVALHLTGKARG